MDYYTITSFTKEEHKEAIIEDVRKTSIEEVPMIQFIPFEGNEELTKWIAETVIKL